MGKLFPFDKIELYVFATGARRISLIAVPVVKVTEILHEAREDVSKLNIEPVTMIRDSLLFLGSANFGMVKKRQKFLKKELHLNMIVYVERVFSFLAQTYSEIT